MPTPAFHPIADALWNSGRKGVLLHAGRIEQVGFVIGQGVLLLPGVPGMNELSVSDASLHVPDDRIGGLGLQLQARLIDEHAEATSGHAGLLDRWEAYHGRRGSARFAICAVESAKLDGQIADSDELELVNTIANEAPLLRALNADRVRLVTVAQKAIGMTMYEPLAVGIDQRGIDLRTRTGVLRLQSPIRMDDAAAKDFVSQLLGGKACE